MSGYDLMLTLQGKVELLDKAVCALGNRGRTYAQAEHDYKVALAEKMLVERDNGLPVTIIRDICMGDRAIAKKRFERDVSEAAYKAALEAINSYKLQIRVLENQIQREWTSD